MIMSFFPFWPIPAIIAAAILFALVPYISTAIDENQNNSSRAMSIDGLRGFLAIGVFLHHYSMMSVYLRTGKWVPPPSKIYALLGQSSVAMFFMITGFLFWGKLVRSKGSPAWSKLYIGRIFRIGPLYLAVVIAMIFIAFEKTNWIVLAPASNIVRSVATWLCLGIPSGHPDINGLLNTRLILSGVTWTLHFEWLFYFSLLPISFFATRSRHLPFTLTGFGATVLMSAAVPRALFTYGSLFFGGMLVASLSNNFDLRILQRKIFSILALICLLITFTLPDGRMTHAITVVLLTLFFATIASGNTFFGVLVTRPALRLGNISYSLYLTQGLAITAVFWGQERIRYLLSSPHLYWLFSFLALAILLVVSSAGYLWIEKPGIACGKWLSARGVFMKSNPQRSNQGEVP